MLYSVVQNDLQELPIEVLQECIVKIPNFTLNDAYFIKKNSFGFLFENISFSNAEKIASSLRERGYTYEVLSMDHVRFSPLTFKAIKMSIMEEFESFLFQNTMNEILQIRHKDILGVVFGEISSKENEKITMNVIDFNWKRYPLEKGIPMIESVQKELPHRKTFDLIIDLITNSSRIRLDAKRCRFEFLYDLSSSNYKKNFIEAFQLFQPYCCNARYSLGATKFIQSGEIYIYPSLECFEKEGRWIFYKSTQNKY